MAVAHSYNTVETGVKGHRRRMQRQTTKALRQAVWGRDTRGGGVRQVLRARLARRRRRVNGSGRQEVEEEGEAAVVL